MQTTHNLLGDRTSRRNEIRFPQIPLRWQVWLLLRFHQDRAESGLVSKRLGTSIWNLRLNPHMVRSVLSESTFEYSRVIGSSRAFRAVRVLA